MNVDSVNIRRYKEMESIRTALEEGKTMYDRLRRLDEDSFDVIVVGAGTGGLTAAALLARRGKKVLVLDQHYVAGGNATVFRRKGYQFDVGLHYIGDCGPDGIIPRVLRAAGVTDVEFEELDPNGYDTMVFPDFVFRVPKGIEALRERLCEFFPKEKRGIDRYISLILQIEGFQRLLGHPAAALWTIPRSRLLLRWRNATLAQFLDTCTSDKRLQAVLAGQNPDYGLPPSRVSVLVAAGLTLHYLGGAYFPKGGGQVLSDRLAEAVERYGGKILLRSEVERIVVHEGEVKGVELKSRHLGRRFVRAPVVISNADLKRTFRELVGEQHLGSQAMRRTERFEMSPALAVLYLGLRRNLKAEGHPRTNYLIYPDYDHESIYSAVARGELPEKPAVYISIASLKDPTNTAAAPEGVANLQLLTIAPSTPRAWGVTEEEVHTGSYRKSETYRQRKRAFAEALIAAAERVFPGLREDVVHQEVATPLTQSRFTGSTGGTSYGVALTPEQFLMRRPGTRTEIKGLYLCGASCRTGHGIAGVALSGLMAASQVIGRSLVRDTMGAVSDHDHGSLASGPAG